MSVEPRRIDRYEILAPISEGGMAAVYHARFEATGAVTKEVALKLIHPHLSQDPEFVRMFITEMRVAMAMSHRNVVQTFDAGKFGERYYLVMELMNRGSLSGVSSTPLDIAVLVAMEVCAALDYAHTFRDVPVIHRDISPSNILLSDQGDVKLADFGVAKVTGQLSRTATGMVKGKLRYMAPEQARGEVDRRSDLFALGAVLYWMVTGQPLRPNPSLDQVRSGDRIELPEQAAIPAGLQALIGRCLERDPEQRPASAARLRELLARELGQIQAGMNTDGDPLARLRGFLASLPPAVARPDPKEQPRRLAEAMLQAALAVPTHHGRPTDLDEMSTIEKVDKVAVLVGATTQLLKRGATAETSISPIRERQQQAQRAHGPLLGAGLAGAGLFIVGVIVWALWPGAAAVRIVADVGAARGVARDSAASPRPDTALDLEAPEQDTGAPAPDAQRAPSVSVRLRHAPRGYGRLDLNSSPFAEVYVDGRPVGQTPLQGLRLRAGPHVVKLVNRPTRLSARLTVQVRAGRVTRRWIRLGASLSE